jgi:aminoglycoside phosphotransferase (APT) family kinase protein
VPDEPLAELRPPEEMVPLDWDAVRAHLAANGMHLDGEPPPGQFRGGLANLNYLIFVDGRPVVLRRPPPGELPAGAYDMGREHRILSRLADALPFIPRGLLLCEDRAVIGVPFQLIEFRKGLTVRATVPEPFAGRPEAGARLSEVLLSTLAAIHAVDPDKAGLGDLGRPQGFIGRAVAGWRKRGAAVQDEVSAPLIAEIGRWLDANQVPDGAPALLHNDFKLDNMILDPADLSAIGVVDWDQGTRGDPLFDLATTISYWTEPGDPPALHEMAQLPTTEPGFLTRRQAVERYAALSGRNLSDFRFHRALGMFKTCVIFLQLGHRHRSGVTREARYAGLTAMANGLLEFTLDIIHDRAF